MKNILGIEVDHTWIRAVELIKMGSESQLLWTQERHFPEDIFYHEELSDGVALAKVLQAICKTTFFRKKKAVVAVPDKFFLQRGVQISHAVPDEALFEEIQKLMDPLLPYPIDEAYIDFSVEAETMSLSDQKHIWVSVASQKQILSYMYAFKKACVKPIWLGGKTPAFTEVIPQTICQNKQWQTKYEIATRLALQGWDDARCL